MQRRENILNDLKRLNVVYLIEEKKVAINFIRETIISTFITKMLHGKFIDENFHLYGKPISTTLTL